ncbi:MAG: SBBP repeat-containing protein [Bacteroidia bacterium]|nr:SBBP repeat-containing protein [Bacteroidia bacterium]
MKYTLFFLVIFCLSARDAFSQYLSVSQNKISKQNTESKISHNQFIKNLGQWDSRVLFMTKQKGLNAWLTRDGMIYDFYHENISQVNKITDNGRQDISRRSGHVIAMRYGNSGNVTASGTEKKDEYYNYFIGNDPTKWASDVPLFYEVKVENMYPGISYRYYFDGQGLRYDILLSPGADISMINMTYQGAEAVSINDNGDLVLKTSLGDVIQNQLFAYQETDGKRNGVRCSFVVKNDGKIGFDAEWKDRTKPLIIDPLVFSTFVGSSSLDQINDIAVDASGIVITGKTAGVNFPTTTGAYDISQNGNTDAFVAKLNPSGSGLVFSTFIGGSYNDEGDGVSIGTNGIIIMAGSSSSSDYPTTSGVYDHTFNHVSNLWYDCVISKFNANGNILSWSTFLGGSSDSNFSSKVSVDPQGKVTVLGYTYSNDFPVTTGSYDNTFNGSSDIFVTRLNNTGVSLIFSTFVGGSGSDIANKMVQDGSGNIYVCGMTNSSDFPVTLGTFDHTYNNGGDGFVFQLNYLGTSVGFATYIGGSGNDVCNGISLDGNNNIYVTGSTISSDFPVTTGAYSTSITSNLSNDAFVLKMNTSGTSLIYSTYIGGSNEDCGNIITVDASGNAIIAGYTASNDFPTESFSYDNSFNGAEDVFVSKINSSGSGILYSTFIGGVNNDIATGMIISGNSFIIAGNTYSPDYPRSEQFI